MKIEKNIKNKILYYNENKDYKKKMESQKLKKLCDKNSES